MSTLGEHRYGPVEGSAELVGLIEAKLARENGITVRPASRLFVTAGGNQAFVNAVLAVTDPGDEVILPAPFYFNHEMAVVIAGAVPVGVPTTREYQLDVDGDCRGDHAADAGDRHRVAQQPDRRGLSRSRRCARSTQLCRDRGVFHIHDEAYEYFAYAPSRHFSPGSIAGCGRAHDLALLAVEGATGWRAGGSATWWCPTGCGRPSTRFRTRC